MSDEILGKPQIHPSAIIDPSAEIEDGVEIGPHAIIGKDAHIGAGGKIGPFCVIGQDVHVGAGTHLHAQAQLMEYTRIGKNCEVFGGAIIGGPPQDTKYRGERSYVVIGNDNILREFVTVHRATGEENVTRIGDHNMLMAYAHVAHNCDIGNHITIASYVGISGHVSVEDHANFGGITGVHQYCRVGTYAMIGGLSGVVQDVPPYMLANGRPARVYDINKIGLRRAGIGPKVRNELRQAYKLLYCSNLNMSEALENIADEIDRSPELDHLLEFIHISRNGRNKRGNDPERVGEPEE